MKKSKLRILVLLHPDLMPPDKASKDEALKSPWKTEYHVVSTLRNLGHSVHCVAVLSDLAPIRDALSEFKPQVVFNLLEEFAEKSVYDQNIVSYLQLLKIPFTGNTPRGLILSRDKALGKKILTFHRIPTPMFQVFPLKKKIHLRESLKYPLFVKSQTEEASLGISQASIVHNEKKLKERIEFIHDQLGTAAMVESYIDGREIYVGILGNQRIKIFTPWELTIKNLPKGTPLIATSQVKHSIAFQERNKVEVHEAKDLPPALVSHIKKMCKRTYRALHLSGYARIDMRLSQEGIPYVLEANPNPDISEDGEFALAAKNDGIPYPILLEKIVSHGLRRPEEFF